MKFKKDINTTITPNLHVSSYPSSQYSSKREEQTSVLNIKSPIGFSNFGFFINQLYDYLLVLLLPFLQNEGIE